MVMTTFPSGDDYSDYSYILNPSGSIKHQLLAGFGSENGQVTLNLWPFHGAIS